VIPRTLIGGHQILQAAGHSYTLSPVSPEKSVSLLTAIRLSNFIT